MVRAAAVVCAGLWFLLAVPAASASGPLFPTPLHLTRQDHDSISGTTAVLDEYAYGNQLVSIRGTRTSIADYEKGRLTEIDRAEGTYSVTRFDALAKATEKPADGSPRTLSSSSPPRSVQSLGARTTKANRTAEFFQSEIETKPGKETIEIGVDRSINITYKRTVADVLPTEFTGASPHEGLTVRHCAVYPPSITTA